MATMGTAGHVDHGKSTLVQALTGIDPDRLVEEKARGMTIDLGFAWMTLPDGRALSIVDVPGHEDFIKNMLAGVGGIDLAVLVVAADEGVMPQTREHLAILDLLRVPQGIVALTKADLVDADWLVLAREDVAATLAHTAWHAAPILPVSAVTGAGLPEFIATIAAKLPSTPTVATEDAPRLPIDRVFTITGFGTVVTGTLLDGSLHVGQEIAIMPLNIRGRVRGIQQHKTQVTVAQPGTRVALNLAGIDRQQIMRGMVATLPDALTASSLLDVYLHCWDGAPRGITHNAQLDLFIGAAETPVQVRLLDLDALEPGASGWAQLRLAQPVAVVRDDRFIVRNPSPSETLGGGSVVDSQPRHHRRHQPAVMELLRVLHQGDPDAIIASTLAQTRGPARLMTVSAIARRARLAPARILASLHTLQARHEVMALGEWHVAVEQWAAIRTASRTILAEYHAQWPLRAGLPREEWRTRLAIDTRQVDAVQVGLIVEGELAEVSIHQGARMVKVVKAPWHTPTFTPAQATAREALLGRLAATPLDPPSPDELPRLAERDVIAALVEDGTLVRLSDDLLMLSTAFAEARDQVVAYLLAHERITVGEARDLLGTTRRLSVPLLEALDALRITRRLGDVRVLGLDAQFAMSTPPPAPPAGATE